MQATSMAYQSPELVQAEKDLQSLRKLSKEKEPKLIYCPACEERKVTKTEQQTSIA